MLMDLDNPDNKVDELMHLRVINANYYLGDKASAARLLKYSCRSDLNESIIQEAVAALQAWNDKALLDNTTGLPREYKSARENINSVLHANLTELFSKSEGKLLAQVNRLAISCDFQLILRYYMRI